MKRVRIGIVGFGTVGRATANILARNADLIEQRNGLRVQVTAVCRRSPIPAAECPAGARVFCDWRDLLQNSDTDILVETIGGTDPALNFVRAALGSGKPLVTANKNLLARHGDEIFALAARQNLPIGLEASVAGSIPIVRVLQEAARSERVRQVRGILNGTANYILTRMASAGVNFEAALEEAIAAGFSEADPSSDIDGHDTRDKLCILARLAFGGRVDPASIPTCGIRHIRGVDVQAAEHLDRSIRLVASATETEHGIELSVKASLVDRRSLLGRVEGVNNAIEIDGERMGKQTFYGPGAGGDATGAAVVADLIAIARQLRGGALTFQRIPGFCDSRELPLVNNAAPGAWYLRVTPKTGCDIAAGVRSTFNRHSIPLDSMQNGFDRSKVLAFTTSHHVSEHSVRAAIHSLETLNSLAEPALCLRLE